MLAACTWTCTIPQHVAMEIKTVPDRPKPPKWLWLWSGLAGGCAATVSEVSTLPMDIVKTRQQLWGQLGVESKSHRPGSLFVARQLLKNEGLASFFKGVTPAVCRQTGYQAVKMSMYGPVCAFAAGYHHDGCTHITDRMLGGGIGGAVGVAIANPFDVVKVRMQADKSGTRYKHTGQALRSIIQNEGFHGLWKGSLPAVQRAFVVSSVGMAVYDSVKPFFVQTGLLGDNIWNHVLSSTISGFATAVTSCPIDTIKTRLMSQPIGPNGQGLMYAGVVDCIRQTVKTEGVWGLYKGVWPTWMRIGPFALVFFVSLEHFQNMFGVGPRS